MEQRLREAEAENAALRASLRDLHRACAANGMGSWRPDVRGGEMTWSVECRHVFGLAPGARASYAAILECVHPDDRAAVDARWQAALRGEPFDLEHRIVVAGEVRWVRERAAFEFDAQGALASGLGTAQDITARKRMEAALRENEERLCLFVDGAPVGIAMFDCDMRYIAVSRRYRDDYFTGDGDLIGRSHYDVFPDTPERLRQLHRRCLAGETVRREEDPVPRANGSVAWLHWEIRPWFDAAGEVGGIIMFSEDITDRKLALEALKASKAEAECANDAKSRFLAAASHDLRQPLAALALYVDVLGARRAPGDAAVLTNMKSCVAGLSAMLNDLLDLSKLDAGAVTPEVRDFAVADVLANVLSVHGPEARQKGLRLACYAAGRIGCTDPVLFRRMIGNLVSNAVRYTERGGVLVVCRLRYGRMWVEVWDSGIGIPADKRAEIFEEFKQLGNDERSRERGSGLGLAIVARTATLLGLRIRVASRVGRGSMFAVELPPGNAPTEAERACCVQRPLRIALVDDNRHVLDAMARSLQAFGHQVVAADCGARLLALLGAAAPDILVTDYRLGGGEDGFDVITRVRAAHGAALPAIVITGDTHPDLIRTMSERSVRVEHKPLTVDTLQQAIMRATGTETFSDHAMTGSS